MVIVNDRTIDVQPQRASLKQ